MSIFNIGDKVTITEKICANDLPNPHHSKTATVLEVDEKFNRVRLSIDSFPNCNQRDYQNRFWYDNSKLLLQREARG